MVNNLKIALIPLTIVWNDKKNNLRSVEGILSTIHPETDLIILPETFSTGFPTGETKEYISKIAEQNSGETIRFLHSLAEKYNSAIAGSFISESDGNLFNRAFFIEPSGDEHYYDKHHLFTMAKENDIFTPGNRRMRLHYKGWNIAMVICYDIRFPVWCRNVKNEYDILIAVANWPVSRIDAWNKLLHARAIENLAYVCGVNCQGVDKNGFEYDGCSAVIDYKGKDMGIDSSHSGIIYSTLNYKSLEKFRHKFPAWQDADLFSIQ